jgi:hypothetical protein
MHHEGHEVHEEKTRGQPFVFLALRVLRAPRDVGKASLLLVGHAKQLGFGPGRQTAVALLFHQIEKQLGNTSRRVNRSASRSCSSYGMGSRLANSTRGWMAFLAGPWNATTVVGPTTTQTRFVFDKPARSAFYRVILAQ